MNYEQDNCNHEITVPLNFYEQGCLFCFKVMPRKFEEKKQ